jgi:hypothetical protein
MSVPPWGVLASNLIYQLVVRENERPDRPEESMEKRTVLSSKNWDVIVEAWHKEPKQRPNFDQIIGMWELVSVGRSLRDRCDLNRWHVTQTPDSDDHSVQSGPPAYDRIDSPIPQVSYPQTPVSELGHFTSTQGTSVYGSSTFDPPPTSMSRTFTLGHSSAASSYSHDTHPVSKGTRDSALTHSSLASSTLHVLAAPNSIYVRLPFSWPLEFFAYDL